MAAVPWAVCVCVLLTRGMPRATQPSRKNVMFSICIGASCELCTFAIVPAPHATITSGPRGYRRNADCRNHQKIQEARVDVSWAGYRRSNATQAGECPWLLVQTEAAQSTAKTQGCCCCAVWCLPSLISLMSAHSTVPSLSISHSGPSSSAPVIASMYSADSCSSSSSPAAL